MNSRDLVRVGVRVRDRVRVSVTYELEALSLVAAQRGGGDEARLRWAPQREPLDPRPHLVRVRG